MQIQNEYIYILVNALISIYMIYAYCTISFYSFTKKFIGFEMCVFYYKRLI